MKCGVCGTEMIYSIQWGLVCETCDTMIDEFLQEMLRNENTIIMIGTEEQENAENRKAM